MSMTTRSPGRTCRSVKSMCRGLVRGPEAMTNSCTSSAPSSYRRLAPMPIRSHSRMPGRMASRMASKAPSAMEADWRMHSISSGLLMRKHSYMIWRASVTLRPAFSKALEYRWKDTVPSRPTTPPWR